MAEGKVTTSPDLSNALGDESCDILGWRLGINPWRHIYIAVNRGLLGDATKEASAEEEIDHRQAGHSSAIANQIYGLSHSVLAGLSETVVKRYLENSDRWCRDVLRLIP
ncbi:hypothetical protein K523DRAFT_257886, partial [Schizophyllum commune Tattone D]